MTIIILKLTVFEISLNKLLISYFYEIYKCFQSRHNNTYEILLSICTLHQVKLNGGDRQCASECSSCIFQYISVIFFRNINMKVHSLVFYLSWFFISRFSAASSQLDDSQTKKFIQFEQRLETGSIINVPFRCPPDTLKVGNRCRTIF